MRLHALPGALGNTLTTPNGVATGDRALSGRLNKAASKLCRLARLLRRDFVWEWPIKSDL